MTEPEIDAKLFGEPISIKTITGKSFGGIKLIWTVDAYKAKKFLEHYYPQYDILLIQVNWNNIGGLYYFPIEVQTKVFNDIGRENYIKLPKQGTNPRGAEISREAVLDLVKDSRTLHIEINWRKTQIDFNPYKKWIELWRQE
ncbi:MAG: ThaI family type II restriction endonuclease [Candidatus Sumerlaeia bacterium]|nr:ThaI family type II restriction endonuclease [Candidatus Sumerlaeia bacterium]